MQKAVRTGKVGAPANVGRKAAETRGTDQPTDDPITHPVCGHTQAGY